MKTIFWPVIFLFFCLVLLAGCGILLPSKGIVGPEYYPNGDGYSWTYQIASYAVNSSPATGVEKVTFSGTTTVENLVVQKLIIEDTFGSSVSTSEGRIGVTEGSVKSYPNLVATADASTLYTFPLSVGAKWFVSGTIEASVVTQESVTVPAGTFGCYKISGSTVIGYVNTFTYNEWLASRVGSVKKQYFIFAPNGSSVLAATWELTSKNF